MRSLFLTIAVVAVFALFGLFSAVPGRFVSDELGSKSLLLVGVTVFAMFAGASLAQLFVVRIGAGRAMLIGLTILPLGLGALVLALVTTSIVLFVASNQDGAVACLVTASRRCVAAVLARRSLLVLSACSHRLDG
jgi:hypothetical protein